jgi:FkbM family methyltransferase
MNFNRIAWLRDWVKLQSHRVGLDIKRFNLLNSEEALLIHLLTLLKTDLVVDVGANKGQYGRMLLDHGYSGSIYSFEPLSDAFQQLEAASKLYPRWSSFHSAIGNRQGRLVINVAENLVSSSLLEVTEASTAAEPSTAFKRKEEVAIQSLDTLLADVRERFKHVFLKVDVQGYELEVLYGAEDFLSVVTGVQLEMSFVPLYVGGPVYRDIIAFMDQKGFDLYTIMPGFRDPNSGRMLQADGIFTRRDL